MLDSIIKYISPETALRRANARELLAQSETRAYAAASSGRRAKGWRGRSTSANAEVGQSLRTISNRANEFARDNWMGRRILDVFVSHAIGTGIQSIVETGSDRKNNIIKNHLEEWSENSDIEGVLDWPGQQALAVRSMIEGGNSVIRHIPIRMEDAGSSIPFRLFGLEGAQIDTSKTNAPVGKKARLGVGLGNFGKRTGLWLYDEHPSEVSLSSLGSSFVEWNELCHLYRPDRFGQVLGISWFAPLLIDAKELADLRAATVIRERTQACFAGFTHTQPGGANPLSPKKDESTGAKVTRIEPGMIVDIGENDIEFASPSGSSGFEPAYKTGLHAMAAGSGITYDQLSGDLTGANYSSLRAGKIEFRRLVEQIQWNIIVPQLIRPTIRKAIFYGELAGKLKIGRDGYRLTQIMPAVEPIDPKKDLEADILACRAGRMSPQEFITAWGRPWQEVVEDTASFFKYLDTQGSDISLDIDGRKPRNGAKK